MRKFYFIIAIAVLAISSLSEGKTTLKKNERKISTVDLRYSTCLAIREEEYSDEEGATMGTMVEREKDYIIAASESGLNRYALYQSLKSNLPALSQPSTTPFKWGVHTFNAVRVLNTQIYCTSTQTLELMHD